MLVEAGYRPLEGEAAIIPIIVGETAAAIALSERLLDEGVFVTGFGFPVVPEGTARVRVQMSAALEPEHLERAIAAFRRVRPVRPTRPRASPSRPRCRSLGDDAVDLNRDFRAFLEEAEEVLRARPRAEAPGSSRRPPARALWT